MSGIASMEDCNYEVAVELFESLKYDLLMMNAPIYGSTDIYCDNGPVSTKNVTRPENPCMRQNSICYTTTAMIIAAGKLRVEKGAMRITYC